MNFNISSVLKFPGPLPIPVIVQSTHLKFLLIANIEQEFEHNLAQQIYITDECWNVINASKNATIQLIRKSSLSDKVDSADKLREVILTNLMDRSTPSSAGLSFIKKEVGELW